MAVLYNFLLVRYQAKAPNVPPCGQLMQHELQFIWVDVVSHANFADEKQVGNTNMIICKEYCYLCFIIQSKTMHNRIKFFLANKCIIRQKRIYFPL